MDSSISYNSHNVTITPKSSLEQDLFNGRVHFPLRQWLKVGSLEIDELMFVQAIKPWNTLTKLDRLMVTASAFEDRGGLALTINFSDSRGAKLMKDRASVFRELRNEVSALAKHGPLMMTVETSGNGKLHLHGFLQTDSPQKVVRSLLFNVGGRSANVAFRSKQIKVRECHSAICWATYMTKSLIALDDHRSGELIYISQTATRIGSDQVALLKDQAFKKIGLKFDGRGLWRKAKVTQPPRAGFVAFASDAGTHPAVNDTVH